MTCCFKILQRCFVGSKSKEIVRSQFFTFFFLKTLVWFLQRAWQHCHVGKLLSWQAPWLWESCFYSVIEFTNLHSQCYVWIISPTPSALMHLCISTPPPSMSHSQQYAVHSKCAVPHLIQSESMSDQIICCQYLSGFFSCCLFLFSCFLLVCWLWRFTSSCMFPISTENTRHITNTYSSVFRCNTASISDRV